MLNTNKINDYCNLNEIISVSRIDGVVVNYNDSEKYNVEFKGNMFEEFKKFCKQENYTYELLSKSADCVSCNVRHSITMHFVKCMQSENEETIKMLCLLPKKILINRAKGRFCGIDWVCKTSIELVKEAVKRYDEPMYAAERNKMIESL